MPEELDDQPETIAEVVFRFQIELWEMFNEIEAGFAEITRKMKADLQQIYEEYFFD